MSGFNEALLIAGMFIVTFGVRYIPLLLSGRVVFPAALERALRFVPVAVLTALIMPMILLPAGQWQVSINNPYLVASLVAVAVAAWRKNLLLTIVVGLVVFFILFGWGLSR